jgi:hypothetical protein
MRSAVLISRFRSSVQSVSCINKNEGFKTVRLKKNTKCSFGLIFIKFTSYFVFQKRVIFVDTLDLFVIPLFAIGLCILNLNYLY